MKRRVAYYETWAADKECDSFRPERIPAKAFTHLNIAFGGISTDHKISLGMIKDASMIRRITRLKGVTAGNPALQIYIAVGGWAFNDPGPTRTAFSDMVSTAQNRQTFINSVMDFLETHALDGIDFDWEYPGADDRGGKPEDVRNYVTLISGMRAAFDKRNPAWGISMAIPASYWQAISDKAKLVYLLTSTRYLQHFDIKSFERSLTFFNLMVSVQFARICSQINTNCSSRMISTVNGISTIYIPDLMCWVIQISRKFNKVWTCSDGMTST